MTKNSGNIYIGIAGWSYPDWEGIVYPKSSIDKLAYISAFVDCIEINSTFYRPPDSRNSASWLSQIENHKDFFFTAKLHKDFTHQRTFDPAMVSQFKRGLSPLLDAGRLRHLLIQFRYDFTATPENRSYLKKLVENFKDTFTCVVEVRHNSWQQPETIDFLKELGVTLCNLDCPIGPTSFNLPDAVISSNGYMRMHGRNAEKWFSKSTRDETYDYFYPKKELAEIFKRIRILADRCKTYIVVANNHYKGAELANALELKYLLIGLKQSVPEGLLQKYPHLTEIARNPNLF